MRDLGAITSEQMRELNNMTVVFMNTDRARETGSLSLRRECARCLNAQKLNSTTDMIKLAYPEGQTPHVQVISDGA